MILYIIKMSRKQKYPRDTNNKKPSQLTYKPQCVKGWHCKDLLDNRCQLAHDKDDFKYAKKIQTTFKHSSTIIILDTYDPKLNPVCLLDPFLIPNVTNLADFKMDVGKYYSANLLDIQSSRSIDLRVEKELGSFGKWEVQERILADYFPKEYQLHFTDKQTKKGEVKINGQYQKVITGSQGKKYYFPIVNKPCPYPILGGCKVNYFERNNTIEFTKIIYPHQIRLSGIIQIDKNSQFYFISRNEEYDDMNPYHVPGQVMEKLRDIKGLLPYSFLRLEPISEKDQQQVNDILREYLVKGRFKAWPHQSIYPIVELVDQVSFKNFKSLKDGIIYEAGISMTPFDKKQKEESQKLAKSFKIDDHAKKRGRLSKSIFTVDSKSTKCHDDAIFIQPTQQGEFYVQIHIADVAAIIQEGDNIDKKIKKRDETIYIKNYHQPMLYDSLKNLFSLFEEEDKLAFTLAFKVNSKGFIDYKTVQFHKNIINVEKNLCHQRIQSTSESYPELNQLNQLFQRSRLIDNNYILESQTKSQIAVNRLIFISSIIPTFLLDVNIKRAKEFKQQFQVYLKDMIDKRKKDMEKWEDILDRIDKEKDTERKYKKQLTVIQKNIDNELKKQRAAVMKRLKEENANPAKKDRERIVRGLGKKDNGSISSKNIQSEDEDELLALEEDYQKAEEQKQEEQALQQKNELVKRLQQKVKKEKRAKALKEVHASDFQSSSQESSQGDKQQSDSVVLDEQYRFNAAVGGKRFLEKIFRHPLFNIDMKWSSLQEINNAFKTILSKDKGKLYQEYFKRLQIMNRQHFRYIIKMEDCRREKQEKKPVRGEERMGASDEPQQRRRYIIQEQNQEEKQEKKQKKSEYIRQSTQKKQLSSRVQGKDEIKEQKQQGKRKYYKKQQSIVLKQKSMQRKRKGQPKQEQLSKKPSTDQYMAEKSNYQTMANNIFTYMKKQRVRFVQKYSKQYQKDRLLKDVDISFNENDQNYLRDNKLEDYMNQKYKVLLNLFQQQEKKMKRKAEKEEKKLQKKQSYKIEKVEQQPTKKMRAKEISQQDKLLLQKLQVKVESKIEYYTQKYLSALDENQKIEFSSDEDMDEVSIETKSNYKQAKRTAIFKLLGKQIPQEKKRFQLDRNVVKLTHKLINYMETNKEKMIEKYSKFYEQDPKLTDLDISFTQRDQKMSKNIPVQEYKKHKISRLKVVLRRTAKENKGKVPKQARGERRQEKKEKKDTTKKNKPNYEINESIKDQETESIGKEEKNVENVKPSQLSLTHILMSYMQAEKDRLIEKYAQTFEENPKLTGIDVSFTQRDQEIIKEETLQLYKKEKIYQLKVILRRHAKSIKNQMKQQARREKGETKKDKTKPMKEKLQQNGQHILESIDHQTKQSKEIKHQRNTLLSQKIQNVEKLLKEDVKSQIQVRQEPSLKIKQVKEKKPEKLGKKAMKKRIDDQMQSFIQELNQKYKTQKQVLTAKLQEIKHNVQKQEKNLEEDLQSANEEYNLLKLLAGQQKPQKKQGKKSKKDKKKDNEKTKAEKSSVLGKFLDNFQLYADKANYKFQKMSITQLDNYLSQILSIKQLCSGNFASIQALNRQASKKGQNQQSLLKWNNPIRSYESLTVMRLIQSYKWLFEGEIYPSDIIRYYSDIKHIEKQLKEVEDYRNKKIEKGELNKKVKEANRQISKLQFYNLLKRDEKAVFVFLNIGSPNSQRVKFVFHPILEEVEVENLEFKQDAYKEVKGRVKIVREFPLKLRIILEK